ncbi:hypothetical protein [Streptomyces pactum]|uniref:Uncharacterized protein n=1 Tax=Streptomyces pactum TaxID=68249 RepID=A0A1S6J5X4_9ACTN|nr:hypothetical protein [Streptomyces pactum]AQS67130.1 hypothetical protein B1H29_09520 [Streptomyces pactum]
MHEKPDDAGEMDARTEVKAKRIDLSMPQVAGSALAAVVAAKLASSFGVYGTILGAGLISVVATCGGSVLQHFFKRTGEQIRVKRSVGAVRAGGRAAPVPGGFTEGTVYRARTKGWKRPVIAAALVFGVTMAGITTYELVSGESLSGGRSTTVGSALTGHDKSASDPGESGGSGGSESGGSGGSEEGSQGDQDDRGNQDSDGTGGSTGSGSGDDTPAATPSGPPGEAGDGASSGGTSTEDGGTEPSATPTPEATGTDGSGDATSPAPDASATVPVPGAGSRSGTAGQDLDGSAAP